MLTIAAVFLCEIHKAEIAVACGKAVLNETEYCMRIFLFNIIMSRRHLYLVVCRIFNSLLVLI